MPRTLLLAAALAAAAAPTLPAVARPADIADHATSTARTRTVTVQADNFRFCAGSATVCTPTDSDHATTVTVGTRVRWVYRDTACDAVVPCPGHNVVFAHFGSAKFVKTDGATIFSMVFKKPGTFSYFCGAHQSFGMTGRLVVTR